MEFYVWMKLICTSPIGRRFLYTRFYGEENFTPDLMEEGKYPLRPTGNGKYPLRPTGNDKEPPRPAGTPQKGNFGVRLL